jgi:pimeloyl-ACP methyl ester carboxylesterase
MSTPQSKPGRRWRHRVARAGLVCLGLVVLFFVFTFVYARLSDARALADVPQDSLLVDVGGRNIHLHALGLEHNGPAVVLLPGFSGHSAAWAAVQPELAKTMRVYAYDPAGFAWSDPPPQPLTPSWMADDLHAALTVLGENKVILVAFSGGALTAYNYYHRYPDPPVAGLVWVEGDAMIPGDLDWYNGEFFLPLPPSLRPAVVESGLWRVLADLMLTQEKQRIPPATQPLVDWNYWQRVMATSSTRQTAYTVFAMTAAFPVDVQYTASLPLPDRVPVFALHADYGPDLAAMSDPKQIEDFRRLQSQRAEWFKAWAAGTPGGRYIPVANSSHFVVYEQPQIVIEAVQDMVKLASAK